MKRQKTITTLTLWINRLIIAIITVMLFVLKPIIDWYCSFRVLSPEEQVAIMIGFYLCSVFILYALWNMDKLLRAIRRGMVFFRSNVQLLRRVQWCCGIVSLICIPASCIYLPIVFIAMIMAFLFLCISVVSCVLDTAVALREESDLTI